MAEGRVMGPKSKLKLITAFNEALVHLYTTASLDVFSVRVHEAFAHLVPNTCVSYDEIDHRTGVIVNSLDKPLPLSHEEFTTAWGRWAAEHPGVIYRRAGGRRNVLQISDVITKRQFSKTSFYNEFWRLLGIKHQISVIAPLREQIVAVSINRDKAFTAQEVEIITSIQPHFALVYQMIRDRASAQNPTKSLIGAQLVQQLSTFGNIEAVNGSWKGNVITGKLWRSGKKD